MNHKPAIVVVAYNRPDSLQRLLYSLSTAIYQTTDIKLIISIDKSNNTSVYDCAENFNWQHGLKTIIKHNSHLGLKQHILSCGDLSIEHDSVIILEDDLLVSPYFYEYATKAADFYSNDTQVAGISLYNYQVSESSFYAFKAIDDGSDVYFMQVASSWGQLWTKQQWESFKTWLAKNPELTDASALPSYLFNWGKHSWKKHFIHYLIDHNKFFVFPKLSLSTNFEEEGTNSSTKNVFHVPLQSGRQNYSFVALNESKSIYDAWFEITPQCLNKWVPALSGYNYMVDLFQTRQIYNCKAPFVLTSRKGVNPVLSYSKDLFPPENNIILNLAGNGIGLYKLLGQHFETVKPGMINFLDRINPNNTPGVSVIIPVLAFNGNDLQMSIASVVNQNYPAKEIIVVCEQQHYSSIENLISYEKSFVSVIPSGHSPGLAVYLQTGIASCHEELICWMHQGSVLSENIIGYSASIFTTHPSVNWIRGINNAGMHPETDNDLNTFDFRFTPNEAYQRLQKDTLNPSTELDFIRASCLRTVVTEPLSQAYLFFHLIRSYQLFTVVFKFGTLSSKYPQAPDSEEKAALLQNFHLLKKEQSFRSKLSNLVIKTPLFTKDIANWYYTAENNFPDVLRYDNVNSSFFLNKY